jgi:hypothetical protein
MVLIEKKAANIGKFDAQRPANSAHDWKRVREGNAGYLVECETWRCRWRLWA